MKFATLTLLACSMLGLIRSSEIDPTDPTTIFPNGKKSVAYVNKSLTVRFGELNKMACVKVIPCYGLKAAAKAERAGDVQAETFNDTCKSFSAKLISYSEYPTLTLTSTAPGDDYEFDGMFEVFPGDSENALTKMFPEITNPIVSFKINMKKGSDDNRATLSWDPVKDDGSSVEYTVYRRDVKIGSGEVMPTGVYDTPCGVEYAFNKGPKVSCTDGRCGAVVDGLKIDHITTIMVVATKTSTGGSVAYYRVNLNDGASAISCFMALILLIAFFLF